MSRGGSYMVAWMIENDKENPLFDRFDRVVSIMRKYDAVLSLGGLISANLAVVNLLPVPPFDGFYVLMVGWEGVTRRRVNEHIRHTLVAAGFIVIIALLFVLTYKDIFNIVRYGTP